MVKQPCMCHVVLETFSWDAFQLANCVVKGQKEIFIKYH